MSKKKNSNNSKKRKLEEMENENGSNESKTEEPAKKKQKTFEFSPPSSVLICGGFGQKENRKVIKNENPTLIRGKWMFNGSKTIDHMIEKLKYQMEYLKYLKKIGWNTIESADDDYVYILNSSLPRTDAWDQEEDD